MSRVNEDCYVNPYIQQRNTAIAYETFLSLQLLRAGVETMADSVHLRAETMLTRQSPSAVVGGACTM